ncbi:MobF family relaxase [Nocardioides alkalitolerans]|uniref:MobF family relaxase n=1 Tax=Nocardioides alkalitolerans TaxID=281714 RepID=UPI000A022CFA|nr:MobF family relaxase [Nocardioides alkalitolerans]
MSLHKLSAGDGYQYLIRQTAAADQDLAGRQQLADYYSEKGEAPGRWFGEGIANLIGVESGSTVSAEQMRALFGEGRHPNADALESAAMMTASGAPGAAAAAARAASALGRRFSTPRCESDFVVECSRAYEAFNIEQGQPRTAPVPDDVRAEIRTSVATRLFTEKHGRPPAPGSRELSGFIARESRPAEQPCAGYDLTFSPVKSVSALWAVADRETSEVIEAAHQAAVEDTVQWLEREVIYSRRGAGGVRTVDVDGVLAAAFVHRDARSGDPDLHTHVAIANKVRDPSDGAWLAIDGQVLYKHTVAASERYNTRIEAELSARLDVSWTDTNRGPKTTPQTAHESAPAQTQTAARVAGPGSGKRVVREIAGVTPELLDRWSQRRTAIEDRIAELTAKFETDHGRVPSSKEALGLAQQANLDTREAKHEHRSLGEQRDQWRREALEVLGGSEQLDAMLATAVTGDLTPASDLTDAEVDDLAARVVATVEGERARFQAAHVIAETQRVLRARGVPVEHLEGAVDRVTRAALNDAVVQPLSRPDPGDADTSSVARMLRAVGISTEKPVATPPAVPAALQRADGTSQYARPGAQLYSTTAVIDAEKTLVEAAAKHGAPVVSDLDLAVAFLTETANGLTLNEGQQDMVRALGTSGARVQLALAPAGTGKTTAMRALANAWRNSGGNVLALAPTAAAAKALGASLGDPTGSPAETLAKLLHDLRNDTPDGAHSRVYKQTLIVVDEAGMASTPDLADLVRYARERGATVRLVGDDQQLAAVGAGGALRDIATEVGAVRTLADVVRFTTPGEAAASLALREGHADEALGFLLDHHRVQAHAPGAIVRCVFEAWQNDQDQGLDALMIAATNDQVTELNRLAQLHRHAARDAPRDAADGGPAQRPIHTATVALASGLRAGVGDTVVTRRNNRQLRLTTTDFVKNGDRWLVDGVNNDGGLVVVHRDTGRAIVLPPHYVSAHVDLGYATTIHGAQGQTVDACHTLITGAEDRASLYVAMTRGRSTNLAYVAMGGDGDTHNVLHPDQAAPKTATETLRAVIERDNSAVSARTTIRHENDPATALREDAAIYRDALGRTAELHLEATAPGALDALTEHAEALVPGVSQARSWPLLRATLALHALADPGGPGGPGDPGDPGVDEVSSAEDVTVETESEVPAANETPAVDDAPASTAVEEWEPYDRPLTAEQADAAGGQSATGETDSASGSAPDPTALPAVVRAALADLERAASVRAIPDDVDDLAALLLARAHPTPSQQRSEQPGPLPWLAAPPAVLADSDEYGTWLSARERAVKTSATALTDQARAWTPATAPAWAQPVLHDTDLVADLAVWRAANDVTDVDLRPAGPRPSDRNIRRHYNRLTDRVRRVQPAATGRSADWWATHLRDLLQANQVGQNASAEQLNALVDNLAGEHWWPVLTSRLDELAHGEDWITPELVDQVLIDQDEDLEVDVDEPHVDQEPADQEPVDVASLDLAAGDPTGSPTPDDTDNPGDTAGSGGSSHDDAAPAPAVEAVSEQVAGIVAMHRLAEAFYRTQFEGSWAPQYLEERGLDGLLPKVGYAPRGQRALVAHLVGHGYTEDEIAAAGLATERATGVVDRFRNRLVLPIHATLANGEVAPVGFVGRAAKDAGDRTPKYLNTSTTPAYVKGETLYGLAEHRDLLAAGAVPVLVEGPLDAEAVTLASATSPAGSPRMVGLATCGTALTAEHVAALGEVVDLDHATVVVAGDNDSAGRAASARAWDLLATAGALDTRTVALGSHKDPAALLQGDGPAALATVLEQAVEAPADSPAAAATSLHAQVLADRLEEWAPQLDHIDGRLGAVRSLAGDIARGTPDQQAHASALLLMRVDLDSDTILTELDRGRGAKAPATAGGESDDQEELELPGQYGVDAILAHALRTPLPDEHAAAALWSRIAAATGGRPTSSAGSPERVLTDRLDIATAARVTTTPQWPAIRALTRNATRPLVAAIAGVDTHDFASAEDYATALLAAVAPGNEPAGPDGREILREARARQRLRERVSIPTPGPSPDLQPDPAVEKRPRRIDSDAPRPEDQRPPDHRI